jgi:hypothetical protein
MSEEVEIAKDWLTRYYESAKAGRTCAYTLKQYITHLEAELEEVKAQTAKECVKVCRRLAEDYREITHHRLRRDEVESSRASAECVEALLEAVKQIRERVADQMEVSSGR